jgi:large subunit ribosomal protein L10
MLTKQQKNELIENIGKKLKESQSIIFAEFGGVSVADFLRLKRQLKLASADLKVIKKRLLNIALKNSGIQFDSLITKAQLGAVFTKKDAISAAGLIHKFSKELEKSKKGIFSVIGAYDLVENKFISSNEFRILATLPSREILLAQIAMMLIMPLKQFMTALNERSKTLTT